MSPDDVNRLLTEVDTWSVKRGLYPGWVIAPERAREHLFDHSSHWIERIIAAVPSLEPQQRLRVLDELNWRLETALVPLFPDLAESIRSCLEAVQPFPDGLPGPQPVLRLTSENLDSFRWTELQAQWVALALALLRFHREERQRTAFSAWAERLDPLVGQRPEWQARLCYERCLYAFGRMDEGCARASLARWPVEEHDPIWLVRKAAVLAELGDLREAGRLAESALRRIRTQAMGPDDFASLSREGYALLLINGLEGQQWFTGQGPLPDYRGRWEHLARFRCDPWVEIEQLEGKLERDVPRQRPTAMRSPGFQPGTSQQTFQFAAPIGLELLPAYQYMRLTEEAPYPPYCGNTGLSGKTLETAARWFADHDPVRVYTLLCRLHSLQLNEEHLKRYRVAALTVEVVNELIELSLNSIHHAELRAMTPEDSPENQVVARLARRRLAAGIELLARLAVRLAPHDASRLLTRALELYRSPVVQRDLSLPKPVGQLFESLLRSMSADDLGRHLADLMALPVPGSPDLPVPHPELWPDFLSLLPEAVLGELRRRAPAVWRTRVQALLDLLIQAAPGVRGRIALRLQRLSTYGCLTIAETRTFARLLWRNLEAATQLPNLQPFRRASVLALPEPREGMAAERMRAYLNQGDILRVGTRTAGPDGREHWGYTQYADPDVFLIDWLRSAATSPSQVDRAEQQYLQFSLSEVSNLFRKLRRWWDEEGRAMLTASPPVSPFTETLSAGPLRQRVQLLLDVLRDVIMPRVTRRNRLANDIDALVQEVDQAHLPVHAVLPALLKYRPDAEDSSAAQLLFALTSADQSTYFQGVRGLLFWLRTQGDRNRRPIGYALPPPPRGLLQQLGANLAGRRQPGLDITLDACGTLVSEIPQAADAAFLAAVQIGLQSLLSEATYRTGPPAASAIPAEEIPHYRLLIARLVRHLAAVPSGNSPTVRQWIAAASADPLPEVRQAAVSEPRDEVQLPLA